MSNFRAIAGVVHFGPTPMTDADCIAVGEVFRTELWAALSAQDDAAHEVARSCLHALRRAEHEARIYRAERIRAIRLDEFNREHGRAA